MKLKITVLGEFSLTYKDKTIKEQNTRSKKLWILLEYLVANRKREISQNELIDLLWGEAESDNPAGALKTLMHRLRSVLDELGLDSKTLILNNRNSYSLNNQMDIYIDADEFVDLCGQADNEELSRTKRINLYKKAMELYKGDYMMKSSLEQWIIPITVYYHSLYIEAVKKYVNLLSEAKKLTEILWVCEQAVTFDPYDEKLHYDLIKTLVAMGDFPAAIAQYQYVKKLYYTKFGVNPSSELTALYEEVVKTKNEVQQDLDIVVDALQETNGGNGAYYCEYEFFKYIYQLEMREATRSKRIVSICLLTVRDKNGNLPEQKILNKAMQKLTDCTGSSLRKRDVYARFSVSQLILMLPSANEQAVAKITQRIKKCFAKDLGKLDVVLEHSQRVLLGNTKTLM